MGNPPSVTMRVRVSSSDVQPPTSDISVTAVSSGPTRAISRSWKQEWVTLWRMTDTAKMTPSAGPWITDG